MLTPPIPGARRTRPVSPEVAARMAADQARRVRARLVADVEEMSASGELARQQRTAPRGR